MPRFVGPFRITKRIGEQAYELLLPPSMASIHPVFHVSQLRLSPQGVIEQPGPIVVNGETQYEVDRIIAERKYTYRIRWTGYDSSHDSWISK